MSASGDSLGGARVAILEGRAPALLADLIRRHGGEPRSAPALREVPTGTPAEVAALLDAGARGEVRVVLFLTGVGAAEFLGRAVSLGRLEEAVRLLSGTTNVCRGQKPWKPLKEHGIPIAVTVPSPYTTEEVLRTLACLPLRGRGVAILHHGERSAALSAAVEAAGGRVHDLCLYEWALPEETGPLEALVEEIVAGEVDAVAFTTQAQLRNLLRIAERRGRTEPLLAALRGPIVVAAVGPTCAAALEEAGIPPDVVPANPKMGPMVAALAAHLSAPDAAR